MSNSDSAWPEAWSAIYDAMDLDRSPHLAFYTRLVTSRTQSLLDLGCGTGSITLALAAAMPPGARVTGVDLAPKMIEIARRRAPQHEWVVGDICDPPVAGKFDLIVICFHTLQMLLTDAQLHQAFRSIAAYLAPAGRFAFDIYQPNLAWLNSVDPAPSVARQYIDSTGRGIDVVEANSRYDSSTAILSGEWTLRDSATGRPIEIEPIVQRVRQYFPADIDQALAQSGMRWTDRFGELDRQPFTLQSKRQVYICTRS